MENHLPEHPPLHSPFPENPSPAVSLPEASGSKTRKGFIWSVLSMLGLLLLKGKGLLLFLFFQLKYILAFLKFGKFAFTAVSMITTIWVYALFWGWYFALGFVILIFLHEMGHAVAIRMKGMRAGAPVFIPFVGAMIALKDQPRDAKTESYIAYGGPLAGAVSSAFCFYLYEATRNHLFLALAYTGFFLNLFNLIPMSPLDGGRIVTAVSTKLWGVGLAALLILFLKNHNVLLLLILVMGAVRLWTAYKEKETLPRDYYEVSSSYRWGMGLAYLGLIGYLGWMTIHSLDLLNRASVS